MRSLEIGGIALAVVYAWPWITSAPSRIWASFKGHLIGKAKARSQEPIRVIVRDVSEGPPPNNGTGGAWTASVLVTVEGVSELLEASYQGRIARAATTVARLDSAHKAVRGFLGDVEKSIVTDRLVPATGRLQGALGTADSWLSAVAFTLGLGFVLLDSVLFGEFVESLGITFGTGPLPYLHGLKVYHLLGMSLTLGVILTLFAISRIGVQRRWLYSACILAVMLVVFALRLEASLHSTSTGIPTGTYWLDALFSFIWATSAVGVHELLSWVFTHCTRTAAIVGCCILGASALLVLAYFGILLTFVFRSVLFAGWMALYETTRVRCVQQRHSAEEQKEAIHRAMVETILRSPHTTTVEERPDAEHRREGSGRPD